MDYSLFNQEEEQPSYGLLKKARARISTGGTLSNNVMPGTMLPNSIEGMRSRASDLYKQGAELYDQEPDMSQLQAFAKQRGQQADSSMLTAMAAQFAGDGFAPVQEQLLKKAAAARDPIKMGSGLITPEGQYIKDPEVTQNKKAEFLMQQGRMYEQLATQAETKQEQLFYRSRQDAINNELRAFMAQTARMAAGNHGGGNFTPTGFTPSGDNIVTNSKNGLSYIVKVGPDGLPSYTPFQGASIPKASYEKQITEAGGLAGSAFNADRLIKMVETNPGSFGLKGAAVSSLPGGLQGYASKALELTPQQMAVRANVLRDAALEINQLYGAALSMGEDARAKTFIPDAKDPPETVIIKLKAAHDWANSKLKAMPQGVQNATGARGPGTGGTGFDGNDPLNIRR